MNWTRYCFLLNNRQYLNDNINWLWLTPRVLVSHKFPTNVVHVTYKNDIDHLSWPWMSTAYQCSVNSRGEK